MTTPSPNMGNPVNASKFNSSKLVPPSPPKLQFMDMPKLNFVNAERLPAVPGAVPSEGIAASAKDVGSVVPVPVAQMGGRRKSKSTKQAKATKSSRSKKGGALIDDVKNLAVPFAILLAKQGLQTMFDKKKTPQTAQLSAKVASQPTSSRRRTTAVGGSCGSACAAAASARPVVGGSKSKKQSGGVVPKLLPPSGKGGSALPKPPKSLTGGASVARTTKSLTGGASVARTTKTLTGGARSQQVKSRFEKLSKEIDAFLQKY